MVELARLSQDFFARSAVDVARDLIGCTFLFGDAGGRIVETEAYAADDPSSHAYRGMTARNAVMFGPPGRLYVYFVYGMHFCANVSCEAEGVGAAVLLRALEPIHGLEEMAVRRGPSELRRLCSGLARLAQALGIARAANGLSAVDRAPEAGRAAPSVSFLARPADAPQPRIIAAERIGVRDDGRPWRFLEAASPFVSRRPSRSARSAVSS